MRPGLLKVLLRGTLLGLAIAALAIGALAFLGYRSLERPHAGWPGEAVDVQLEPGLGAGAMLGRLEEAGVLADTRALRIWLRLRGGAGELRAGEYRFESPVSPFEVLARLREGDVLLHAFTLPEGLHMQQVARRVAEGPFATEATLLAAMADPGPILDLDPAAPDLEGYLFPDTYHFPRGARADEIVRAMVARFREVTGGEAYAARAATVGLDLRGAVTLASMIEAETSVPEERPRISRVFHNRLARGMRMQCDPTVLYALLRAGQPVRRLALRDLAFESEWNTYVATGLPPGPIANPGAASLAAAVAPADGDELYFVAAPGGGHRFSATLDAHEAAVADWRAYSRSARSSR